MPANSAVSNAPANAVLYARVSSREQEQEGYSIPAQLKLLKEYAVRNGFNIAEEFIEVETAKAFGRKRFGEMVKYLATHPDCRTVIVEKTDRLYRNLKDYVILEEMNIEIHLPKEGQIISRESRSQAKLMHGLQVVIARSFIDNLREEVRKGMREKAEQGVYPSRPPLGYANNVPKRSIEVHPVNSRIVTDMFALYATGEYSLARVRTLIRERHGRLLAKGYLHKLLQNRFYTGFFEWDKTVYRGTHETLVSPALFDQVQSVMHGHNRPKYRKHEFAFGGLLTCAHDSLSITAEVKKGKYVYYHCTGYKGKCGMPYMRQEALSEKLGQLLKGIHIPDEVSQAVIASLRSDQGRSIAERRKDAAQAELRIAALRGRMEQAYFDKLDGKITEEFWGRMQETLRQDESRLMRTLEGLQRPAINQLLNAERALELANKAHLLYESQTCNEKGKLLRLVLSNCSTDGVSLWPVYRKPFDMIFNRVKNEEWCARRDSNPRPSGS